MIFCKTSFKRRAFTKFEQKYMIRLYSQNLKIDIKYNL